MNSEVGWFIISMSIVRLIGVPYFRGSLAKEALLGYLRRSYVHVFMFGLALLALRASLGYSLNLLKGVFRVMSFNEVKVGGIFLLMYLGCLIGVFSFRGYGMLTDYFVLGGSLELSFKIMTFFWVSSIYLLWLRVQSKNLNLLGGLLGLITHVVFVNLRILVNFIV